MKLAGIDAMEDVADGCGREHSGFIRLEHPTGRRAQVAPNEALAAKANRRSLPLLNREFSFGSRSLHLLEFGGRIFRSVCPGYRRFPTPGIVASGCAKVFNSVRILSESSEMPA